MEKNIQVDSQLLETLFDIESGILADKSPQTIAENTVKHVIGIIPCMSVSVSLFDFERSQIDYLATENPILISTRSMPIISEDRIKSTFKNNNPLNIENLDIIPRDVPFLQEAYSRGARSLMAVPLSIQDNLLGSLSLISEKIYAFDDIDLKIAQRIADSLAIAIHITSLLAKEQRARQEAETLGEVARNLNVNLNKEDMAELILAQLEQVIPYGSASISLLGKNKLEFVAQRGSALDVGAIFGELDSLPPNVVSLIEGKTPTIIADTHLYQDWVVFSTGDHIRSWMGIPLMVKSEMLGVLMLYHQEPDHYSKHDLELAAVFANQAATAIENAHLNRQTQQYVAQMERRIAARTRDLSALYEITSLSNQQLDLKGKMDKALSIAINTIGCEIGMIFTFIPERNVVKLISWSGDLNPQLFDFIQEIPTDIPFIATLLQQSKPIIVKQFFEGSPPTGIPLFPTESEFSTSVPIRSKGKPLGILALSTMQKEPFSREDIALIGSIADQIGEAIEHENLQKQSEKLVLIQERERFARDLHDSATQALFSLTLFATAAGERLSEGNVTKAEEYLDDIGFTANQVHKDMRLLLYELRPSVIKEEGLISALRQRLEIVEARTGVKYKIIDKTISPIPEVLEDVLFRVTLEALNNISKHAAADIISIILKPEGEGLTMKIIDNGRGFDIESITTIGGFGLSNMRQRVEEIDGHLELRSIKNEGTTLAIWVPLVDVGE